MIPGVNEDKWHNQNGERDQRERHAVDTDRVARADHLDPFDVHEVPVLQRPGVAVIEVDQQKDGKPQGDQRSEQGHLFVGVLVLLGDQDHDQRPNDRSED